MDWGGASLHAQGVDSTWLGELVRIETGQNVVHTGTLLGYDDTEYLVETANQGNVTIPKYLVVSIVRLDADHIQPEPGDNLRPSRNFITATAFPVQKGVVECSMYYIAAGNLDVGLTDRLTLSVSSAWIIATSVGVKYTLVQGHGITMALSGTIGSLPFSGFSGEYTGAAGRGILTFGNPDRYFSLSGGYFSNFGKNEWVGSGGPYGGGYWNRNRFSAGFAGLSGYTQLTKRIGLSGEVNMGLSEGEALGFGILGVRLGNKRKTTAIDFGISAPIIPDALDYYFFMPYVGAMFKL